MATADRGASHTLGLSYSNPLIIPYCLGSHDFGAAGETLSLAIPPDVSYVKCVDIQVSATETFTATTTEAFVRVGTAADNDLIAELALGTLADTNAANLRDDTDLVKDADNLVAVSALDSGQIEVNLVAPTGGTPAGIGYVFIILAFW